MTSNPSEADDNGLKPSIETLTEKKLAMDEITVSGADVISGSKIEEGIRVQKVEPAFGETLISTDQNLMKEDEARKETLIFTDGLVNGDSVMKEEEKLEAEHVVQKPESEGDQKLQVEEQEPEQLEKTDDLEDDWHDRYYFPLQDDKITGFDVGDLVWGKVKSHPWWPGQIFDPKYASEMAVKRQKKDHFLVAYFGDRTFAWCHESQLKPFQSYFLQMEKHSSVDDFVIAVDCSIGEVSRRVELGMSCYCLADEIYGNLKYQKVENSGIREGTCSAAVNRSMIVNSFQPESILEYVRAVAECPFRGVDRLELEISKAQLKAFYRSKGHPELPVFVVCEGLVENDDEVPQVPPSKQNEKGKVDSSTPVASDIKLERARKVKLISEDGSEQVEKEDIAYLDNGNNKSKKCKVDSSSPVASDIKSGKKPRGRPRKVKEIVSEQMEKEDVPHLANGGKGKGDSSTPVASDIKSGKKSRGRPRKLKQISEDGSKQGSLSKLMEEQDVNHLTDGDKGGSGVKSVSQAYPKKRRVVDADSAYLGKRVKKNRKEDSETKSPSSSLSRPLKVGDRISRAASQLKGSPLALNSKDETSEDEVAAEEYSSPSELLSQLCLAARDPMKGYSFLSMIIRFFTEFRVSLSAKSFKDQKNVESVVRKRGRKKKEVNSEPASSEMSVPDYMQDSFWSDIMIQSSPEREPTSRGWKRKGGSQKTRQKKQTKPAEESLLSAALDPSLDTEQVPLVGATNPNDKQEVEGEKPRSDSLQKIKEETPTALILSFNESDALPSAIDLIKIFCRYGPLREGETEVLRKTSRAKVVFKNRDDAEKAFSSAGKYSVFGPALVSYRLRYSPSPKSSPGGSPHDKNDASPTKDGNLELSAQEGTGVTTDNTAS